MAVAKRTWISGTCHVGKHWAVARFRGNTVKHFACPFYRDFHALVHIGWLSLPGGPDAFSQGCIRQQIYAGVPFSAGPWCPASWPLAWCVNLVPFLGA